MTFRQTETSREIRLWITQVIIPAAGAVMVLFPEAREAVVNTVRNAKDKIEREFKK